MAHVVYQAQCAGRTVNWLSRDLFVVFLDMDLAYGASARVSETQLNPPPTTMRGSCGPVTGFKEMLQPGKPPASNWVVVSNILYFHSYLGKIPILTSIFQCG